MIIKRTVTHPITLLLSRPSDYPQVSENVLHDPSDDVIIWPMKDALAN